MSTRDAADRMLSDHIDGLSLRDIGKRYGVSHEKARQAIRFAGDELLDRVEDDLRACKSEGGDRLPSFIIPSDGGEDFEHAVALAHWVVTQLAERGVECLIHYRPAINDRGVAIGLIVALEMKSE